MNQKPLVFDWSSLTRQGIIDSLHLIAPKLINADIEPDVWFKVFSSHVKRRIPVLFEKAFNPRAVKGTVMIGGLYDDTMDQDCKKSITVTLIFRTDQKYLNITARKFKRISELFADTLLHEIIHMRQYRRRDFKVLPGYQSHASREQKRLEQNYLGHPDEIDAYSFNIACELIEKFGSDTAKIQQYLDNPPLTIPKRYDCWRTYLKAFDYDHDHVVIKRVKTKALRYLPNALLGKPYKNKDWICY